MPVPRTFERIDAAELLHEALEGWTVVHVANRTEIRGGFAGTNYWIVIYLAQPGSGPCAYKVVEISIPLFSQGVKGYCMTEHEWDGTHYWLTGERKEE